MSISARAGLLLLAAGIIATSLVSACSQRTVERLSATETAPAPLRESPVATRTTEQAHIEAEPSRGACTPTGALGVANPSSPGSFLATFDGAPAEPLSACGASDWDIQVHSRDPETWYVLDSMAAQHGADCAGPPATHETHGNHAATVFLCRDHLMTALRADAYGVIYLTPNQLVDLRAGPVTIRFDLSTERMSTRDWVDLWLTPWGQNMALPLEGSDPDLQGPPLNSIQVTTTSGENAPTLIVTRDGRQREYQKGFAVPSLGDGVTPGTNESATRQPFQLTLGGGRARFERLASKTAPALLFWDEPVDFPFESAVLQFGHHSYNPTKDAAGIPATWHWDNLGISRSIPFELTRAAERYADVKSPVITFDRPSGPGSWLRFSAIGKPEVSFDGGATWTAAIRQGGLGQLEGQHHPEHFSSYWMQIPEGVAAVQVRFKKDDWYTGPYFAQGFAIWSLPAGVASD